ncbi:MAG TPA: DNA repair exonuclease [Bacillota bacterium]|nr:DNA repair exonuclease [Bacillota bacterium]
MSVTIFHCADLHLDTPFALSLTKAEKRNSELRSAFRNAILYAKSVSTQLFFIAGDLFDSQYVTLDTAESLINEFKSYPECRFFITPGNHDPYDQHSPYKLLSWPQNVHIFTAKERVRIDELNTDVYGFGFTSNSMTESPVTGYLPLDPERINILVCHGTVGVPLSKDGPILVSDIEKSGFDYIALGHIHKTDGVKQAGKTSYAYSGCIEGRGFDELGYKGGLSGTVSHSDVRLKGIRLSLKRFETVRFTVSGQSTKPEIVSLLKTLIREYGSDTALRIVLDGEMPSGVMITADDFTELSERPYYLEIKDNSVPYANISETEGDMTLRGVFYRQMCDLIENEPQKREIAIMALRYGLSALADRNVTDFEELNV